MKRIHLVLSLTSLLLIAFASPSKACTNYLITKGASVDGSTMISYAADSHLLYGELYHWPAGTWPEGTMMDIHEWDTGKYLGQIAQASETYNVVGNMNEHQVAIGETTFTGIDTLKVQEGAIMDYGSLIYVALQRSKSAREAIKVMTDLVAEYGYASTGESFSIADKNEVWIMELIGKGNKEKGAVWVARRIPEGYISGHANQARITTFPQGKAKNAISSENMKKLYDEKIDCIYSADVVSFARDMGLYVGDDKNFSFSDTYNPLDFGGARFCEIRVWTMFNNATGSMTEESWEYVKGNIEHAETFDDGTPNPNHYATNRMPLWVKPEQKVSLKDMMSYMRDHLEGTELDMRNDVGAGPFGTPYRWRPLTWEVDSVEYCNERATATQQTGFSFISQSRSWLPDALGGIIWWGVDDASGSVYMPMFSSITTIPENFAVGNGALMEWSETSGFWIFNQVQNFAYTRYNYIHPDIELVQSQLENKFISSIEMIDKEATALYTENPDKAAEYLNQMSNEAASETFSTWKGLYAFLFMKYMDGNIKTAKEVPEGYKYVSPELEQPGYSKEKYKLIIEETGDQFKVIGESH
jgi:dipeptidase